MVFAIGAAASAIDLLQSLTSKKTATATQGNQFALKAPPSSAPADSATNLIASTPPSGGNVSPATMSALLDAQSQSGATSSTTATKSKSDALKDLFGQIDGNNDGSISKSEFENALGAGGTNTKNADSVFNKLDTDGDGQVSLKELTAALISSKPKHAHHGKKPDGSEAATDPLLKALDEANEAAAASRASSTYAATTQTVQKQIAAASSVTASSVSVRV